MTQTIYVVLIKEEHHWEQRIPMAFSKKDRALDYAETWVKDWRDNTKWNSNGGGEPGPDHLAQWRFYRNKQVLTRLQYTK